MKELSELLEFYRLIQKRNRESYSGKTDHERSAPSLDSSFEGTLDSLDQSQKPD